MMLHKLIAMRDMNWDHFAELIDRPDSGEVRRAKWARENAIQLDDLIQEQGWQPIETAPRDIAVLIYAPAGMKSGIRRAAYRRFYDLRHHSYNWYGSEWHKFGLYGDAPTHWMPLPDPPAEQKE